MILEAQCWNMREFFANLGIKEQMESYIQAGPKSGSSMSSAYPKDCYPNNQTGSLIDNQRLENL
jgi:hypothetical protein